VLCLIWLGFVRLRVVDFFLARNHFRRHDVRTEIDVALWKGDFDAGFPKFLVDREVQVTAVAAGTMAHLVAPGDQLEIE